MVQRDYVSPMSPRLLEIVPGFVESRLARKIEILFNFLYFEFTLGFAIDEHLWFPQSLHWKQIGSRPVSLGSLELVHAFAELAIEEVTISGGDGRQVVVEVCN